LEAAAISQLSTIRRVLNTADINLFSNVTTWHCSGPAADCHHFVLICTTQYNLKWKMPMTPQSLYSQLWKKEEQASL